jgi:pectinesterase
MRIINIGIIFVLLTIQAYSQQVIIQVENLASFDRKTETIEIPWNNLSTKLDLANNSRLTVFDEGHTIVHQIIDIDANGTPDLLLFQSSFKKNEKKQFTIMKVETNVPVESITDAKYILPRKDVAWENDRIAFRIYGGPLAGDVRNGLDVWVKRVRYHIIDKWYDGDSLKGKKRISYHVDHGEGADMFNVGKTLGAGGSALWVDSMLCQSGLFTKEQIIATGPIRAMFTVTYDTVCGDGQTFQEEKTYTLDAGENLNRISLFGAKKRWSNKFCDRARET